MSELFDSASGAKALGGTDVSPNTNSWTHTPVNIPNAIIVDLTWSQNITNSGVTGIVGINYGGIPMSLLGSNQVGDCYIEKWGLLNPLGGPQSVDVTWQNDDGVTTSIGSANSTAFYSDNGGFATFGALQTSLDAITPITGSVPGTSVKNVISNGYLIFDSSSAAVTATINGTGETKRSGFTTQFLNFQFTRRQTGSSTQNSLVGTVVPSMTISANRSCAILSAEVKELIQEFYESKSGSKRIISSDVWRVIRSAGARNGFSQARDDRASKIVRLNSSGGKRQK